MPIKQAVSPEVLRFNRTTRRTKAVSDAQAIPLIPNTISHTIVGKENFRRFGRSAEQPAVLVIAVGMSLTRGKMASLAHIPWTNLKREQRHALAVKFFDQIIGIVVAVPLFHDAVPADADKTTLQVVLVLADGTAAVPQRPQLLRPRILETDDASQRVSSDGAQIP